jgi:hypothetical protein
MFSVKPDLNKVNILARVSELDIFRYYCSNFIKPGVNFCADSDIRKDPIASCRIDNYKGNIKYKDFAEKGTLTCFGYVMMKFHCTYVEALRIINKDFNLELEGDYVQSTVTPIIKNETYDKIYTGNSEIKVLYKEWEQIHIDYINSYYLDYKRISKKFFVNPIDYYWVNGRQFKAKELSFAYYFGVKDNKYLYKIYQPGQTKWKWMHNLTNEVMQGWLQLPKSGEGIVITKAFKDVFCYDLFNIPSIAPPAEGWEIPDSIMDNICERFPIRLVNFDFDRTGIIGMNRLKKRYGVIPVTLTNGKFSTFNYQKKDFSDYLQHFGIEQSQEEINIVKYKLNLI